jgi:hypothetical protein
MLNNRFHNRGYKPHIQRTPDFDSGVVSEPLLAFGGRHEHIDPKTGLALYGPYTIAGQTHLSLSSFIVGIVGPADMIADAEQWLSACKGVLTNDGTQPFLYPHFPGFNSGLPFQCELITGDTWHESIKETSLQAAVGEPDFTERIKKVTGLYIRAIETLATHREPRPHVILCCIPQEVIDYCTVQVTRAGEVKRIKISRSEHLAERAARNGQLFLFSERNTTPGTEDEEWGHQNLRRGLKAEAMQFGIPTQLVWPRTLRLIDSASSSDRQSQDIATRAWNFTTALYYKAGGTPWRLAQIEPDVCFVGVSFYKELLEPNPRMRTSMAQTFTAAGDGYVLRGNAFEWDEARLGKSPHLDQNSAAALMRDVLDLYQCQNKGSLPRRIIVHKTSKFWQEELTGFDDACQYIPQKDFVALGKRGIQFYRTGDYPPLRGTYIKFSSNDLLLYTVGYIPFLRTYPGPRVPQPIEILEHHGDSPWNIVLEEILALTKLNWNTADFANSVPITIAFSQRVGQILAELPQRLPLRPEYRFYM